MVGFCSFVVWFFFFYSFFKLLLGLRPCIWWCQFYLSQSWEQWGLCCSLGSAAGLCAGLAEQKSVAQAWCLSVPQGHPSPCPLLMSILSFPLILWWKVHASSLTREWCFFLFFLSPCLNFLASLLFLSLYSLPFVSDAEMKIVGCKFLLFCVMSAFCLLFSHFHIFHGMLGLIKTANHNITGKLWEQGGGAFVSLHTTGFQANLGTVTGGSVRNRWEASQHLFSQWAQSHGKNALRKGHGKIHQPFSECSWQEC